MAFLGEEDAHPYGQNDLAVKIEKSTLHAPKVTVSNIVDGLIRRKGLGVRASGGFRKQSLRADVCSPERTSRHNNRLLW
jgi:hypothetical protein